MEIMFLQVIQQVGSNRTGDLLNYETLIFCISYSMWKSFFLKFSKFDRQPGKKDTQYQFGMTKMAVLFTVEYFLCEKRLKSFLSLTILLVRFIFFLSVNISDICKSKVFLISTLGVEKL